MESYNKYLLLYLMVNAINCIKNPENEYTWETKLSICPKQCVCTADVALCSSWADKFETVSMPDIPETIRVLLMHKWPLQKLPQQEMENLKNLHSLTISQSNLTEFPAFGPIQHLTMLDLSNNKINKLPPKAFKNIPYLTRVNISHNAIMSVDSSFLEGMHNLMLLDISHNPIIHLSGSLFGETQRLGYLDLSHCNMQLFDQKWMDVVNNLYYLNISHNSIQTVPQFINSKLEVLDVSHNPIKKSINLINIPNLSKLIMSHTNVSLLNKREFQSNTLQYLDLSFNKFVYLEVGIFKNMMQLKELYLNNNYDLELLKNGIFNKMNQLLKLDLKLCISLREIEDEAFNDVPNLESLSLENTELQVLPKSILNLKKLIYLSVKETSLLCDCHAHWIPKIIDELPILHSNGEMSKILCRDGIELSIDEVEEHLKDEECSPVQVLSPSNQWILASPGQSALLECNVTGDPQPSIIWQTVDHHILTLNKSDQLERWMNNKISNAISKVNPELGGKFQVLESGQLLIRNVERKDIGRYKCFAYNAVSNASHITFVGLDTTGTRAFFVEMFLFGWACAALFLLINLVIQFIKYLVDRMGCECCCCQNRLSSKAKQIRQLLETVEGYKSVQLERLRENYNGQVESIKESCYSQMDKVRDSYGTQQKNLKNLCDYSTQQISGARDQYLDQVHNIRDYSMSQMSRVRENYVFQRQRIRKFSAHQLIKLRETYKYQQKTLNKLLETLPDLYIQNCRTGACRTDSMIFDEIDGLDIYYKVDFLDNQSFNSSDYYTPNSTLTRPSKKQEKRTHSREGSNTSGGTDYQDTISNVNSISSAKNVTSSNIIPKIHKRFHIRSLSLISPPTAVHKAPSAAAKGHKRSISVSQPKSHLIPFIELTMETSQKQTDDQMCEQRPLLTHLATVDETRSHAMAADLVKVRKLSKSESTINSTEPRTDDIKPRQSSSDNVHKTDQTTKL